jgi:heat shock protein HslJ
MYRRALLSLLLLAVTVSLSGCGAENQVAELTANPWVATQIQTSDGVKLPLNGTSPAIFFSTDGIAAGNATVNSFKGPYTAEGRNLKIGPLVSSDWVGPQMEAAQDAAVLEALASTARYHIQDGELQLSDAAGNLLMGMKVAQEPKLVGPVWKCTEYVSESGDLASTVGTSQVVAEFAPDGTLAGSGGVNQYSAPYTAAGSKMTIGPEIASTEMAGPEELMAQEAAYLDAIARTAAYKIEAYQLVLLDSKSAVLAKYMPLAPKN